MPEEKISAAELRARLKLKSMRECLTIECYNRLVI